MTNSQEEKLVNRRRSIHDSKVRISENCKINTVNILKKIEIIKIHGQHEWKEKLNKYIKLLTKIDFREIKSTRNPSQNKRSTQVYSGGMEKIF